MRWRKFYLEFNDRLQEAQQPFPPSVTPMQLVLADVSETLMWSAVAGVGVAMIQGAMANLVFSGTTLSYSIGASGVTLLFPIMRDGVVNFVVDIIQLFARRNGDGLPTTPNSDPIQPVMVRTDTTRGGGTWRFYNPPTRLSGEPVPAGDIRRIALDQVNSRFTAPFTLRNYAVRQRVISDPDFRLFQGDLVAREWAEKTPRGRVVLKPKGMVLMSRIASGAGG